MSLIILAYAKEGSADKTLSLTLHPQDPAILDISAPTNALEANPKLFVYECKDVLDDRDYSLLEILAKLAIAFQSLDRELARLSDRLSGNPTEDNNVDGDQHHDAGAASSRTLSPDISNEDKQDSDDQDDGFFICEALNITPLLRKTKNDKIIPITANAGIDTVKKAIPFTLAERKRQYKHF